MKIIRPLGLLLIFLLAWGFLLQAQECASYMPLQEGTSMEIKHFTAKDKLESSTRMTVKKKISTSDGYKLGVHMTAFDEKGKSEMESDLTFQCKKGEFIWDMNEFLKGMAGMDGMAELSMKVSGSELKFPAKLAVGQQLESAEITVVFESGGMAMMSVTTKITNRKMEAKENLTTPAGTFSCYRISYDIETKSMFNMKIRNIDWIAEGVGMVKSQNFDQNNKLQSYSLLTSITR